MKAIADPAPRARGREQRAAGSIAAANGSAGAVAERGEAAAVRAIGGRVLVLNATYEPINVCTVRRAAVLLLKRRAEVVERSDERLHSERLALERPLVIRLVTYVRIPRDIHRRKITRKAVLARDSWTCQYCGTRRSGLTVDHVIPRSRGGKSVWENIVAACGPCNRRKGNRLPLEISMHPASTPKPPGPSIFIRVAAPRVPPSWEPYLGMAA
ncbi:MAG TPA: HNH endonuclease [Solirubrobacterales bacterium]|nr:HNH endonuclease [Solirubrobacterales bacterium]